MVYIRKIRQRHQFKNVLSGPLNLLNLAKKNPKLSETPPDFEFRYNLTLEIYISIQKVS